MKRAAIAALLLLAAPRPVLAGSTCGSSGGGDSSGSSSSDSSSSSSSDSSSYSSSTTTSTPACQDTSDVVGYRQCKPFGSWAANLKLPTIIIQLGTAMRAAPGLAGNHSGHVEHGTESFAYRTVEAPDPGLDHQVVTTMRIGVGLPHGIFVATDLDIGSVVAPAQTTTEMNSSGMFGSPTITRSRGFVVNAAAVLGVQRRMGNGRVGLELAGGVRTTRYTLESSYHYCDDTDMISRAAPLVEARASYDYWLTPFISAGGTLGTSVVERGSWMGSLHFGFHTRAFGGSR